MEAERDAEGSVGSVPPLMLAAKLLILIIIYFLFKKNMPFNDSPLTMNDICS